MLAVLCVSAGAQQAAADPVGDAGSAAADVIDSARTADRANLVAQAKADQAFDMGGAAYGVAIGSAQTNADKYGEKIAGVDDHVGYADSGCTVEVGANSLRRCSLNPRSDAPSTYRIDPRCAYIGAGNDFHPG